LSIRWRRWTNGDGATKSAIVVCWTDAEMRRRLKTFDHLRDAKEYHAIVHRRRPRIAAILDAIEVKLIHGRTITLTRAEAATIAAAFRLFRKT
jgi:hypothetical protein